MWFKDFKRIFLTKMGRENREKKVVVKDTEKNLNLYFGPCMRESSLPSVAGVLLCLVRVGVIRVSWAVRYLDKP